MCTNLRPQRHSEVLSSYGSILVGVDIHNVAVVGVLGMSDSARNVLSFIVTRHGGHPFDDGAISRSVMAERVRSCDFYRNKEMAPRKSPRDAVCLYCGGASTKGGFKRHLKHVKCSPTSTASREKSTESTASTARSRFTPPTHCVCT